MTTEMICAGFGGQGVLTMKQVASRKQLCKKEKNVSWLPSYGP